jgi:hypothetical protein
VGLLLYKHNLRLHDLKKNYEYGILSHAAAKAYPESRQKLLAARALFFIPAPFPQRLLAIGAAKLSLVGSC